MGLDAEEADTGEMATGGEWECMECGHIEVGVRTMPPEVCPDCGAPGQALEFFPYGDDEEDWHGSTPVKQDMPEWHAIFQDQEDSATHVV